MPIPRGEYGQPMGMKKGDITIEHRYDLVPVRYGKAATGKKIILYIHENQNIAGGKLDPHQSIVIHKKQYPSGPVIRSG